MQPQALTRVDGTVLGVRRVEIPAEPATAERPARLASSYFEADVATAFCRYDGELRSGLTACLPVILDDDPKGHPGAGEVVSWLVSAYPTVRRSGGRWVKIAAHRFVAVVPAASSGSSSRAA
jgi:hypothetical protein